MMLRATNTGMTAIIDADGSVRGTLPAFTRGALVGEVRAYTGSTPYVRWGNWPAVTLSLVLLAFAWLSRVIGLHAGTPTARISPACLTKIFAFANISRRS